MVNKDADSVERHHAKRPQERGNNKQGDMPAHFSAEQCPAGLQAFWARRAVRRVVPTRSVLYRVRANSEAALLVSFCVLDDTVFFSEGWFGILGGDGKP